MRISRLFASSIVSFKRQCVVAGKSPGPAQIEPLKVRSSWRHSLAYSAALTLPPLLGGCTPTPPPEEFAGATREACGDQVQRLEYEFTGAQEAVFKPTEYYQERESLLSRDSWVGYRVQDPARLDLWPREHGGQLQTADYRCYRTSQGEFYLWTNLGSSDGGTFQVTYRG